MLARIKNFQFLTWIEIMEIFNHPEREIIKRLVCSGAYFRGFQIPPSSFASDKTYLTENKVIIFDSDWLEFIEND